MFSTIRISAIVILFIFISCDYRKPLTTLDHQRIDSTAWFKERNPANHGEADIFINSQWHLISEEAFMDSVYNADFASIFLTNKEGKKAHKLIFLSEEMKRQAVQNNPAWNSDRPDLIDKETFEFSFTYLNGGVVTNTDFAGKIVVVNYWHIGCRGCIREIDSLNSLVEKYKNNDDVVFIAPSTDTRKSLVNFLMKKPFSYGVATINNNSPNFLVSTHPTHVVISRDGKIKYYKTGGSNLIGNKLSIEIEKCLKAI